MYKIRTGKEQLMGVKMNKELIEYRRCFANFVRTGKREEFSKKLDRFYDENKGFKIILKRTHFLRIVNRDRRFWSDLGFKEINIKSTSASKKANQLIKTAIMHKGKVYYNPKTKNKLAFLIPMRGRILELNPQGRGLRPMVYDCYTIIIL